ncbi:efflux RND transporter periplasmic adaptor subunit [Gracilinema caldarium]|uniref:efflux RND transporter periplasmic adaptor subunit n=1 Tax=Gracilinema caldarium TaxID=215591 RepID=UPI0026E9E3AA|nr:efflux RND transporter periplasmic adaptor subunit [Gracilinema caldarium]
MHKKNVRDRLILSLVLSSAISSALIVSCTPAKGESAERVSTAPLGVKTCIAEYRTIPEEVSGFGSLSFLKKVDITSSQEGTIKSIERREGSPVRSGMILAVLENPQIELAVGRARNAYDQAVAALELARARLLEGEFQSEAKILDLEKTEAELAQARREYQEQERKLRDQEALFAAGGVTEESIRSARFALDASRERLRLQEQDLAIRWVGLRVQDLENSGIAVPKTPEALLKARIALATTTLRAELRAAEARLDAAQKELESALLAQKELTILSPMAGQIAARYMEIGERVKRDDKLLTLMDTQSLYATIPVRERDAQRILPGMVARLDVDGAAGSCTAQVDLVAPTADNQSFTFLVRLLVDPQGVQKLRLKPGMFARATIKLGSERKILLIDEIALADKQGDRGRVFLIQRNQAAERTVKLGDLYGSSREILEGLEAGQVLVQKPDIGPGGLKDGAYVEIVQ